MNLKPHPHLRVGVGHIGAEKQAVILVDNFIENAEQLVEAASTLPLQHASDFYLGIRAYSPNEYMKLIQTVLGETICRTFNIRSENVSHTDSWFSVVTTPPQQLKTYQQLPHFDGNNPEDIAMLHYLCDDSFGGTSFYRHRSSGYEYVDAPRAKTYIETLEAEIEMHGLETPSQYMYGDNTLFQRIDTISAKFNRLIIYRGTSLHSGDIDKGYTFDPNPQSGRLTITSFLYSANKTQAR